MFGGNKNYKDKKYDHWSSNDTPDDYVTITMRETMGTQIEKWKNLSWVVTLKFQLMINLC